MTTMTDAVIKKEKERENSRKRSAEDRDIDEWAKKLLTRAVPQNPVPGQSNGGAALPDLPLHEGFDIDSVIGRFQWVVIGREKFIPCIFRNGIKYCCVRMVESVVMRELLNVLPQEIYHSAKLCSHFATQAEAKLLTYINQWHCDSLYGSVPFTEKDLVIGLQELEEFSDYLTFAYNVLASGGQNKACDFSRCGFVKVNNESLIPYTVLRSESGGREKSVPLFYFEGQTDNLKAKAKMLTGWDLAYLKVCFKVQGVRKELIAGDEMEVVKLSDLKLLFSKQTQFTVNCWPPGKSKSLLPKENVNGVIHAQQLANQNAVEANNSDRMTKSMSTKNGPNRIANSDNNNPGIYAVNNVRRDINVNINGVQVSRSAPEVNTYGTPATAAASANALGTSQSHATCSDATGSVIQNSFAEGLRGISANGDADVEGILHILRNNAFEDLSKWQPINWMIKSRRSEIIRWILHPSKVHRFRSKEVVGNTSQDTSVWWELVIDVFPELHNNKTFQTRIVSNLRSSAAVSKTHFGGFVESLINAHNAYCTVCTFN